MTGVEDPLYPEKGSFVLDENPDILDNDKLPIHAPLTLLRYRTIKKSSGFGWWSAVVLLEDHGKKQVCFYRWRRRGGEWKRDKKIAFHNLNEWNSIKGAVETFLRDMN